LNNQTLGLDGQPASAGVEMAELNGFKKTPSVVA